VSDDERERIDAVSKRMAELHVQIEEYLANVLRFGEELVKLLEAERRAHAEMDAHFHVHIVPPAHD
jgi:hypothetical protein